MQKDYLITVIINIWNDGGIIRSIHETELITCTASNAYKLLQTMLQTANDEANRRTPYGGNRAIAEASITVL